MKGNPFITGNSIASSKRELSNYMVPVYSTDNSETISHTQFIEAVEEAAFRAFGEMPMETEIRLSHEIKMRTQSGIGKKKEDLLPEDVGSYMQRAAFVCYMPTTVNVNGEEHHLQVCGVRNYADTNLMSSRGVTKFKLGVGLLNLICTNMCISVNGVNYSLATNDADMLGNSAYELFKGYSMANHVTSLETLHEMTLSSKSVDTLIGRLMQYSLMTPSERNKEGLENLDFNSTQMLEFIRNLYAHYGSERRVTMWQIYNLFTENKNFYIHNFLEKQVDMFRLCSGIAEEKEEYKFFV